MSEATGAVPVAAPGGARGGGLRLGVLLRIEGRKTWKRLATWVTLGLYALITVVSLGEEYLRARRDSSEPFALPEAWTTIYSEELIVCFIFLSILLLLLVTQEFGWKTARQNVIDGLTKTQWFTGKLLLVPLLGALFLLGRVVVGGLLGWAGMGLPGAETISLGGPPVGAPAVRALGGAYLATLGFGTLALALGLAIRSTGPAMGVWFFWFAFGEQLVAGLLGRFFEGLKPALQYLPVTAFRGLLGYVRYDSEALRLAREAAEAAERTPPDPGALEPFVIATIAWIVAFGLISWLWFRRRDL